MGLGFLEEFVDATEINNGVELKKVSSSGFWSEQGFKTGDSRQVLSATYGLGAV
jgi:hypothetical protein